MVGYQYPRFRLLIDRYLNNVTFRQYLKFRNSVSLGLSDLVWSTWNWQSFTCSTLKASFCIQSGYWFSRTCITSGECVSRGGTSQGSCAAGFGVCCVCKFRVTKTENRGLRKWKILWWIVDVNKLLSPGSPIQLFVFSIFIKSRPLMDKIDKWWEN